MIKRNEYEYTVEYTLNRQLHRSNGPAFERADGFWAWYLRGGKHRYYGPATYMNGNTWMIHGVRIKR